MNKRERKRERKIIEECLVSEIRETIEQATEADATESEMTRLNPPPLILDLAAKAAASVVMAWHIASQIIRDFEEET